MPVVTVSQLNNYMKRYIDQNVHLTDLWVKGEISNYKHHYSGHIYMTLKDENSTLKSVMFRAHSSQLKFKPTDGMKIVAFGKIAVYEPSGTYQLYVESMIPDGVGELYAAYEQLKAKLDSEGLFAQELKKPIPRFPQKLGVVSSISGAALHDILNVLKRRYPLVRIVIYPAKVQGIGSADSVCSGIQCLSTQEHCDVIIVARGGGSIEDLWAFNEEKTARAIFECDVPIISGVGHETDYTISDFVADLRAPTPSAAAEVAVPSVEELFSHVDKCCSRLFASMDYKLQASQLILDKYDDKHIYTKIESMIERLNLLVGNFADSCQNLLEFAFSKKISKLAELEASLDALNPFSVMKRGYSMAVRPDGKLFDFFSSYDGEEFNLVFNGGVAQCIIRRVTYEK